MTKQGISDSDHAALIAGAYKFQKRDTGLIDNTEMGVSAVDQLQTAFEEWMASSNYPEIADIALAKLPDGNYKSQLTFAAWQGWQGGARFGASQRPNRQY